MKRWIVSISKEANEQLIAIRDRRVQTAIRQRIDRLEYEPDQQGKPMEDELVGLFSVRTVGQRYRILYTLKEQKVVVLVVTLGIRKEGDKNDVYERAKKLRRGVSVDIDSEEE